MERVVGKYAINIGSLFSFPLRSQTSSLYSELHHLERDCEFRSTQTVSRFPDYSAMAGEYPRRCVEVSVLHVQQQQQQLYNTVPASNISMYQSQPDAIGTITMSTSSINNLTEKQTREEVMEEEKLSQEIKLLLPSLPREKSWVGTFYIYLFQGFWFYPNVVQTITNFQKHFQAKGSDIVIASSPKSGTTWLKALIFAIVNRHHFLSSKNHPLLSFNPHELVPFFESYSNNQIPDLSNKTEPRLFGTHIPFPLLPDSVKNSNSRIIYISRNPFDNFVSTWHFVNKLKRKETPSLTLDEAFDMYCKGVVGYGPFWEHMLGYWKESLEKPNKVMFLQFEDLKEDTNFHLKSLAKFLDFSFSLEEERNGVIEDIINMCSFVKLKELETNKHGSIEIISGLHSQNKDFFRKGEVGDWVNYFSPQMVEKLSKIIEQKLGGHGLRLKCTLNAHVTNK